MEWEILEVWSTDGKRKGLRLRGLVRGWKGQRGWWVVK